MSAHCSINPDRMIYFVLCRYRDGLAWAERDAGRTNKRDTVLDITNGALPNVVQVIELNYVEFTSRDVTEDFAVYQDFVPHLTPSERLAALHDHQRDLRKHGGA
jgi:hypothetical protein